MTAEVDVIAEDSDIISVQVPERIDFGEISKGEKSEEMRIYINNTGNVDIIVTPDLLDQSEDIFSYLYLRKQKTSDGLDVPFSRIGDFSLNISKPDAGDDFKSAYFYMILDLSDYPDEILDDMINHETDIKFYAVAQ